MHYVCVHRIPTGRAAYFYRMASILISFGPPPPLLFAHAMSECNDTTHLRVLAGFCPSLLEFVYCVSHFCDRLPSLIDFSLYVKLALHLVGAVGKPCFDRFFFDDIVFR